MDVLPFKESRQITKIVHPSRILPTRVCYKDSNAALRSQNPDAATLDEKARIVCQAFKDPALWHLRSIFLEVGFSPLFFRGEKIRFWR